MLWPSLSVVWGSASKLSTVIVGLTALFAPEAQAKTSGLIGKESVSGRPTSGSPKTGAVVIRANGDLIYLSEDGASFEELTLDDTPDGLRLNELLKGLNLGPEAVSVPINRTIIADGGSGAHLPRQASKSKESSEKSTDGK